MFLVEGKIVLIVFIKAYSLSVRIILRVSRPRDLYVSARQESITSYVPSFLSRINTNLR